MRTIDEQTRELLQDIATQAAEIQRLTILCLTSNRVGREWLLKMDAAQKRIDALSIKLWSKQE